MAAQRAGIARSEKIGVGALGDCEEILLANNHLSLNCNYAVEDYIMTLII